MNKDPDIVIDEAPIIILDRKSAEFMAENGKDTNYTRHISIKGTFLRNCYKCKIYKIDWCEEGLQLADIETKNFGGNYLNPIMKYIVARLDN